MRKHIRSTLLICLVPLLAFNQQTKREVTHPPNPAEDTRPNSNAVPEAYAVSTQFQRVLLLRFKYNTDLLAGLRSMVKEQGIKNAVILAGMGSVRNYQVHAVKNRTFPPTDLFVRDPTSPADIIGMTGYILNGRVHAHISLSTGNHAFGGHLEPNTNVFTFAIVTLGILNTEADLSRFDDQTWR
jgi:predicted DNA-binding protein with PD1-like motif